MQEVQVLQDQLDVQHVLQEKQIQQEAHHVEQIVVILMEFIHGHHHHGIQIIQ